MDWFRVYHSILDQPKFARLDMEAIGAWTMFAAVASRMSPRGTLGTSGTSGNDLEQVALMVHRPIPDVCRLVERLLEVGLLERRHDGLIAFYKWDAYQPPSTERTAKHKASQQVAEDDEPSPPKPRREQKEHREHPGTSGNKGNGWNGEEKRREEIKERERDAGAKIPLTSMSTAPDDDPVVDRPRDTQSLDGPIGQNTAEAVREALTAARQVDPEGVLELRLPYWLTKFPARFVTESIWKGKGKGTPSSYVARIIDRGLPPGWAEREAAASKPPKLRPEDVILRAPDYVREAAMARMKRNVS